MCSRIFVRVGSDVIKQLLIECAYRRSIVSLTKDSELSWKIFPLHREYGYAVADHQFDG